MPNATTFRHGYGLEVGDTYPGGWVLDEVHVGHETVRQFERYRYPIRLVFISPSSSSTSSSSALRHALESRFKEPKIFMSERGSPYECRMGPLSVKETKKGEGKGKGSSTSSAAASAATTAVVTTTGTAVRRRDLPTDRESEAHGQYEVEDVEEAKELLGHAYRVVRSHFSTGHCSSCSARIPAGVWIAQPKPSSATHSHAGTGKQHGGWLHLTCALAEKGKGKKPAVSGAGAGASSSSSSSGGARRSRSRSRG
jgi:hypothetical protein